MTARKAAAATLEGAGSHVRRRDFGKNHAYYMRRDDGSEVKLDGVTTLIGDGVPKPALINWAARTVAEKAVDNWDELSKMSPTERLKELTFAHRDNRDEAAAKGTLIHNIAERIIRGEEVDVPDEVRGHVESAVRFMDEWRVREILTETTCYHRKGFYGGTLDLVFTSDFFPGRVFLGDWKTSRSGIYDEAALQLSAYRHAEFYVDANGVDQPMSSLGVTDTVGIWIRSDGYTVYPLETGAETTYQTFRYVAENARRLRRMKDEPLKGEPMSLPLAVAS